MRTEQSSGRRDDRSSDADPDTDWSNRTKLLVEILGGLLTATITGLVAAVGNGGIGQLGTIVSEAWFCALVLEAAWQLKRCHTWERLTYAEVDPLLAAGFRRFRRWCFGQLLVSVVLVAGGAAYLLLTERVFVLNAVGLASAIAYIGTRFRRDQLKIEIGLERCVRGPHPDSTSARWRPVVDFLLNREGDRGPTMAAFLLAGILVGATLSGWATSDGREEVATGIQQLARVFTKGPNTQSANEDPDSATDSTGLPPTSTATTAIEADPGEPESPEAGPPVDGGSQTTTTAERWKCGTVADVASVLERNNMPADVAAAAATAAWEWGNYFECPAWGYEVAGFWVVDVDSPDGPSLIVVNPDGTATGVSEDFAQVVRERLPELDRVDPRYEWGLGLADTLRFVDGRCALLERSFPTRALVELPTAVTVLALRESLSLDLVPVVDTVEAHEGTDDTTDYEFVGLAPSTTSPDGYSIEQRYTVTYDGDSGTATLGDRSANDQAVCPAIIDRLRGTTNSLKASTTKD